MATYWIATTGNDSTGNGTQGNPWLTLSKAISSAAANDTINVVAGTYTFSGQTFSYDVNIVGVSGAAVTFFDGGNAALSAPWTIGSNLKVTGITFQNAYASPFDVFAFNAVVIATFTNCIFKNLQGGAGNLSIFANYAATVTSFIIIGCLFNNCTKLISAPAGGGLFTSTHTALICTLTNCTIYSNVAAVATFDILYSANNAMTFNITNCIIWNANGTPLPFSSGAISPTYGGSNNDILGYSSPPSLPNQISSDPLFVDATNSNFNLRPTSPCIDVGTPI